MGKQDDLAPWKFKCLPKVKKILDPSLHISRPTVETSTNWRQAISCMVKLEVNYYPEIQKAVGILRKDGDGFRIELVSHFWKRWMREWLLMMNIRKKWCEIKPDLHINLEDIGHGRITAVMPGKDAHVRVAKVQVGHNVFVRPITKLVPIVIN